MNEHGTPLTAQRMVTLDDMLAEECPHVLEAPEAVQGILDTPDSDVVYVLDQLLVSHQTVPYLNSMMGFWQKLANGQGLDLALLEVMDHQLVSDVVKSMDQLAYMTQLRLRDPITYSHTLEVTVLSIALGAKLGLNRDDLKTLGLGALLHDLGKLFIPKPIMFKPSRLTPNEFEVMKLHPGIGHKVIKEELKLSDDIARPALEHQEMYGGGGYPLNLSGSEIHDFSHIVKIADVYHALTSRRPYKDALSTEKALKIMMLEGAKSFHPQIFETFVAMATPADANAPLLS